MVHRKIEEAVRRRSKRDEESPEAINTLWVLFFELFSS